MARQAITTCTRNPCCQSGSWQPVGNFNLSRTTTVTNIFSNDFFRVSGPASSYAGAQICAMSC